MLNIHIYDLLLFMVYKLGPSIQWRAPFRDISQFFLSGILGMCLLDLYPICSYLNIYQELSSILGTNVDRYKIVQKELAFGLRSVWDPGNKLSLWMAYPLFSSQGPFSLTMLPGYHLAGVWADVCTVYYDAASLSCDRTRKWLLEAS